MLRPGTRSASWERFSLTPTPCLYWGAPAGCLGPCTTCVVRITAPSHSLSIRGRHRARVHSLPSHRALALLSQSLSSWITSAVLSPSNRSSTSLPAHPAPPPFPTSSPNPARKQRREQEPRSPSRCRWSSLLLVMREHLLLRVEERRLPRQAGSSRNKNISVFLFCCVC